MDLNHDLIRSNSYFKSLDDATYLKLVQQVSVVNLAKGEVLFREGDFADAFYIVKEGAVRISTISAQGQTVFLARLSDNDFFGEQAFSPSSSPRRQATATAQLDAVLYRFPREALLNLQKDYQQLQGMLHKKNLTYLRKKFRKLAESVQDFSYDIKKIMETKLSFPKRSIIYFQKDPAIKAYILVNGEVELRSYDDNKQLKQMVTIVPGQLFGIESFAETDQPVLYDAIAVAKQDSEVIEIDAVQYKIGKDHPILNQLCANFKHQFVVKNKGKVLQFRGEYLEMPVTTSIISLNDGREIVCQQVIGADIFFAELTKTPPTRTVEHKKHEHYHREIMLAGNKIVGLVDYGIWEDSQDLLDSIVNSVELTETQLNEFIETGHIDIQMEVGREEHVCKCMRVSYQVINQLIVSAKADFNEISQKTGAGTICGGCKPIILEMLGTNVWTPCVIAKIIDRSPEVKSFQLRPTTGNVVPFKPGQYLVVKAKINNAWVQRNYTLTSRGDNPYFEITVKKEPKGIFSPWLFERRDSHSIIYIAGPYGQFTLQEPVVTPIACFMGGIGITPAIAFLRHLSQIKVNQRIYVDYSVQNAGQIILREELEKIAEKNTDILLNHRITNIHGLITEDEVQKIISSIAGCHVYMCGPKGLEKLVIDSFNKMDLPPERLHVEQFIHAGAPDNVPQMINLN